MSDNKPFYDEEYEKTRQWVSLMDVPEFALLRAKIEMSKTALQNDIDKLMTNPTLDNSIQASALGKAKNELNKLLLFFDFQRQHKFQLDQKLIIRKTQPAEIK